MNNFNDLNYQLKKLEEELGVFSPESQKKIHQALATSSKWHQGQKRLNGADYIIQPIRAALILLRELKVSDVKVICAALLHDTLEDTNLAPSEIKENFGSEVLSMVQALTISKDEGYQHFIGKVMKDTHGARFIKYADRLDNCRDWFSIIDSKPDFVSKSLGRVEEFYLPLANLVDPTGYLKKEIEYNVKKDKQILELINNDDS